MDYGETTERDIPCGYYIGSTELKMLLAGCGLGSWYGPGAPDGPEGEPSEEQLARAAASLYQRGYVSWTEDGSAIVGEPLRAMIRTVSEAAYCVLIRKREKDYAMKWCYLSGDSVTVAEVSQRESRTLRFTAYTLSEWHQWLWEEKIFPEEGMLLKEEEGFQAEKMHTGESALVDGEALPPYREGERYFEKENVTAVLELIRVKTGQATQRMIVRQQGILCTVYVQREMKMKRFACRRVRCLQVLEEWSAEA